MSASMKWRYLGHLEHLSKAVAAMAEMEVSPQQEMANPQGMTVFAVERPGFPEDFVYFLAVWSAIVATRICSESADCLGSVTGRYRRRHYA